MSGDVNDKVTATGQILARGENDYEADFEWAYLTFQATDELAISAGRIRMPLFRYSASSDVGYSYHWVTAPRSVYDVGFNNIDGLKLDYSNYAGDWEYNLQAVFGTFSSDLGGGRNIGDNVYLFSAEFTKDWFKVRGVYGADKATFTRDDIDGTIASLANAGLTQLADSLAADDDTGEFVGFGVELDNFEYFASAEYTVTSIEDSFVPEATAFYVTAGMRVGKFTPSITYEKFEEDDKIKFLDQVAALPAEAQPTAAAVTTGLQQAVMNEYSLVTLGLRYDYDTNIALKADISKYDDDLNDAADATLVRFAVNYVF
ncbi:topoisomerase IV [Aliiglaciecola sp. M165]|nr:topoisomerase IV [Aliiglaciecola sp. M165]